MEHFHDVASVWGDSAGRRKGHSAADHRRQVNQSRADALPAQSPGTRVGVKTLTRRRNLRHTGRQPRRPGSARCPPPARSHRAPTLRRRRSCIPGARRTTTTASSTRRSTAARPCFFRRSRSCGSATRHTPTAARRTPTVKALEEAIADVEGGAATALDGVRLSGGKHRHPRLRRRPATTSSWSTASISRRASSATTCWRSSASRRPTTIRSSAPASPISCGPTRASSSPRARARRRSRCRTFRPSPRVAAERELWLLMDNTWASPLYFRPFEHGVDVSIQAATKYIVGHADAMLGAITSNARAAKHVARGQGAARRLPRLGGDLSRPARPAHAVDAPCPAPALRPGDRALARRRGPRSRACCIRRCRAIRSTRCGSATSSAPAGCSRSS